MTPAPFATRLTRLFGMRHPIVIGGMHWHSRAEFVAAAARAGVMSFITTRSFDSVPEFREDLARCLDLADGAPIGVNFSISRFRGRNELNDAFLEAALAAGVRRFETAGSHPGPLIERIHGGGGLVIHKSTQVRHALKAQESGIDAVSLVGMEAGGHPGVNPHPSHVLLAQLRPQCDIPIALGGAIGTGYQIAGALAQGADAALIVTRFLASEEIPAHAAYKSRLVASGADHSVTALHTLRDTWRVLDNETVRAVQAIEAQGGATHDAFGHLVKGQYTRDNAYALGEVEKGMLSCSAAVGHIPGVEPVAEIVDSLVTETVAAIRRLQGLGAMALADV